MKPVELAGFGQAKKRTKTDREMGRLTHTEECEYTCRLISISAAAIYPKATSPARSAVDPTGQLKSRIHAELTEQECSH